MKRALFFGRANGKKGLRKRRAGAFHQMARVYKIKHQINKWLIGMSYRLALDDALALAAKFLEEKIEDVRQRFCQAADGFEKAKEAFNSSGGKEKGLYSFYSTTISVHRDKEKHNSIKKLENGPVEYVFYDYYPAMRGPACVIGLYNAQNYGAIVYSTKYSNGKNERNRNDSKDRAERTCIAVKKHFSPGLCLKHMGRDDRIAYVSRPTLVPRDLRASNGYIAPMK
jgi:hypothetical protein